MSCKVLLLIHQAIKHQIVKQFDLLNTIPLTRTKTLVENLLLRSFDEHKLRIILNYAYISCNLNSK